MNLCIGVNTSLKEKGWTSLSIEGTPDILDDAFILSKVDDNSCDFILASHILEHGRYIGPGNNRTNMVVDILKTWYSKLKYDGKIIICVPNGDWIIDRLMQYRDSYWKREDQEDILGLVYGGGANEYNLHKIFFNFTYLNECLKRVGFYNIKQINNPLVLIEENPSGQDYRGLCVEAFK
jgi:predicted SAM-dependent methyltransferase